MFQALEVLPLLTQGCVWEHTTFLSFLNQPRLTSMSLFWAISPIHSFLQKEQFVRFLHEIHLPCSSFVPVWVLGNNEDQLKTLFLCFQTTHCHSLLSPQSRILSFLKNCAYCLHLRSVAMGIISQHFPALWFDLLCTWQQFHRHCG